MVLGTFVLICFHILQWTAFISYTHSHKILKKKEEEEMEESGENGGETEESDGKGVEGERGDVEVKEDRREGRGKGRGQKKTPQKSKSHTP